MKQQRGFTLVELLIATTVFSVILLAATTALIQIGRLYYKGVITSRTQTVVRGITDDLTQSLQFDAQEAAVYSPSTGDDPQTHVVCVGKTRYTFVLKLMVNPEVPDGDYDTAQFPKQIKHAIWKDTLAGPSDCKPPGDPETPNLTLTNPGGNGTNGHDLLQANMRLTNLDIVPSLSLPKIYSLTVGAIYGENDLLSPDDTNPTGCKGSAVGGQWCAISVLYTQASSRVE